MQAIKMQAEDSQFFMYSIGHQGIEFCSIFHILQLYRARITIKSQNAVSIYSLHLQRYQRSVPETDTRDRDNKNHFTISNITSTRQIPKY